MTGQQLHGLILGSSCPSTVQDLFRMVNVLDFLMIYQLLNNTPNWVIHGIQIRWV